MSRRRNTPTEPEPPTPTRAEIRAYWETSLRLPGSTDKAAVEQAMAGAYEGLGLPQPRIHWEPSPRAAVDAHRKCRAAGSLLWVIGNRLRADMRRTQHLWDLEELTVTIQRQWFGASDASVWSVSPLVPSALHADWRIVRDWTRGYDADTRSVAWWDRRARTAWIDYMFNPTDVPWLARCQAMATLESDERVLVRTLALALAGCSMVAPLARDVVLVERPAAATRDKQGRLHAEDGPAIRWPDGTGLYRWHGTTVPADLVEDGWDTARIFAEDNVEIRRCAVERMGWPAFVAAAGLVRVAGPVPDPGNAPFELELYEVPSMLQGPFDGRTRVLLCTNGSPEPDGEHHRFGLTVPARHRDPIAAAAELYGVPTDIYRTLEVRR